MNDERQAREDFTRGEKQESGSLAYEAAYRRLEQARYDGLMPHQETGGGVGRSTEPATVGAMAMLLTLVVLVAAVISDRNLQSTLLGIVALLLLAVGMALATAPLVALVRKPGASGPRMIWLILVNIVITLFHGGLFAWVRDTLPALLPEREGQIAARGFFAEAEIAASQLVQSLLTLLGRPLPVRDGAPFAFTPGAGAFLAVAGIVLLVPVLAYALAIGRAAAFRRALAVSLLVQALLFVACVYSLSWLDGAFGIRIFA